MEKQPTRTLGDDAEDWSLAHGIAIPARGTPEWLAMYRHWAAVMGTEMTEGLKAFRKTQRRPRRRNLYRR